MQDRRCRKVRALFLTTVIILGVSVQNVYAVPENSKAELYNRVIAWHETFKEEMAGFKEIIQTKIKQNQYLKQVFNQDDTNPNEITFAVEQVPKEEVSNTIIITVNNTAKNTITDTVNNTQQNNNVSTTKAGDLTRGKTNIMSEDLELLAKIIYAEARGESFQGQVAVGAVVLNRVKDPDFPKTIKGVVYEPGQFTAIEDKQIELKPDSKAYQAAEAAIEGEDPTNGAVFYYNPKISNDKWIKSRSIVCSIGNHRFCV